MKKSISNAIKYLISLSIVFSTPYVFSDTGRTDGISEQSQYISGLSLENPLVGEFIKDKPLEDKYKSTFDRNSTFLDNDPYFLKSQSWVESSFNQTKDIQTVIEDKKTKITLPKSNMALVLNLELEPVIETDSYLIFSLAKESKVFEEKDIEASSEGLFYLSKVQLYNSHKISKSVSKLNNVSAVQINFFPLPDHGWKGSLKSFEAEQNLNYILDQELGDNLISFGSIHTGSIVIYNQIDGTPLVIELADIEEHEKHMKLNLTLARMVTLEGLRSFRINDVNINPASGTTAAFGNFITGINLESSQSSYWAKSNFDKINLKILQPMLNSLIPKAHAGFGLESIDPEVVQRLLFVGKIVGSTFVGALALKYSIYRERYKKLYEHKIPEEIKKKGLKGLFQVYIPEDKKIKVDQQASFLKKLAQVTGRTFQPAYNVKPLKLFRNEVKGVFDVYAHSLVAVVKTMPITIINVVEYLQDRYASRISSSKNSMIRKSFNATFGWTRGTMKDLAVSHKTWWLGSVVMGTVDTALVVLQLLYLVPAMTSKIEGESASANIEPELDIAEDGTKERSAKNEFVISEIIRNITGYFNSGAYGYSHEQKLIYTDRVEHEVDTDYRKKGIDPKSKEIQDDRDQKIKDKLDKRMVSKGLPGKDEFLFDAISLTRNTTKKMGYSATALGVNPDTAGKFIFEHGRWGLMFPALKKAIRSAKKIEASSPSDEGKKVIALLETIQSRKSRLLAVLKQGINVFSKSKKKYLKESQQIRQLLTLMSFGDDISKVSAHLPDWYKALATDDETALSAARVYSLSLIAITEGEKGFSEADSKIINTVNTYFKTSSVENISERSLVGLNETIISSLEEIESQHDMNNKFSKELMNIKKYKALYDAIIRQRKVNAYQPKKESLLKSPVVTLQKHVANKRTEDEVAKLGISISTSEGKEKYNAIYSKHLAKVVGLSIFEESAFVKSVHQETAEQTKAFMETDEQLRHLGSLEISEAIKYEAEAYASIFLDTYIRESVNSDDNLVASSAQQPGFFQKLRKKLTNDTGEVNEGKKSQKVKSFSKKLVSFSNVSLRAVESIWSTESNKIGLVHMIDRRIPFAHDSWRNFVRKLRTVPMGVSFGYLIAYNVWQVKMDYPVWVLFMMTGFTVIMMVETNNRYMRNIGKKPMGSTVEKIWYAVVHSMLTFPAYIPLMLWADPFTKWWAETISQPVIPKLSAIADTVTGATNTVTGLINSHQTESLGVAGALVATKLATDVYKNHKNKKVLKAPLTACGASLQ